ncbi:MAG: SusC/RagA family TonB-linked outer membrane protein [Cyclobacteriaceae bacterium]|nr:SusC/RagA family TonB-linked outer membrane protein [Cyclobacteriaceae bacterium]
MKNDLLKRYLWYARIFFFSFTIQLILTGIAFANVSQGDRVTGKIISEDDGLPLPGVNVVEKGTTNGVVTDLDGMYSLSVSSEATLVFSSVGYMTIEQLIGNRTVIDIRLVPDITQLEELVVIGYGTAKKSDLTGSIASVTGDDIKKMPVASVTESLTGRMAGVQVTSTEGSPDAEIRIRVRGGGSITQDNSPLFIVDGFPVNSISDVSPSDIKSIDVLKDASSTAIYGARGANGVIIITTKGGTDEKVTVSLNSFYGFKKIAKTLGVLSPEDYVKWQYEYAVIEEDIPSYENYFGPWQDQDMYFGQVGNNWQEQVYGRTGNVFSNDLSVRGGSEKINYSFNYARFDEKAIMIGSDYSRNNVTLKLNNKPNKKVELGFTIRYSDTNIDGEEPMSKTRFPQQIPG